MSFTGNRLLKLAAQIYGVVQDYRRTLDRPRLLFDEVLDPKLPERLAGVAYRMTKVVTTAGPRGIPMVVAEDLIRALCIVDSMARLWSANLARWRSLAASIASKEAGPDSKPVRYLYTNPYLTDFAAVIEAAGVVERAGRAMAEEWPMPVVPDPTAPGSSFLVRQLVEDAYLIVQKRGSPEIPPPRMGLPAPMLVYRDELVEIWGDRNSPMLYVFGRTPPKTKKKLRRRGRYPHALIEITPQGQAGPPSMPWSEIMGETFAAHIRTLANKIRQGEL